MDIIKFRGEFYFMISASSSGQKVIVGETGIQHTIDDSFDYEHYEIFHKKDWLKLLNDVSGAGQE
ncbi:MAG: hypothetical protein NE327_06310 [Lentisphaeraceae bacterium]|nr:hypothetical protein [Lentisphaeraceae bacterium]